MEFASRVPFIRPSFVEPRIASQIVACCTIAANVPPQAVRRAIVQQRRSREAVSEKGTTVFELAMTISVVALAVSIAALARTCFTTARGLTTASARSRTSAGPVLPPTAFNAIVGDVATGDGEGMA